MWKFIYNIYEIIIVKYNTNFVKDERFLYKFIKKSHLLIKVFIYLQFILFNFLSLIKFLKFFSYLEIKKKIKILNFLNNITYFKTKKLEEMIHAIICLQENNNENISKNSNFFSNVESDYIENVIIGSGPGGSVTAKIIQNNSKDSIVIEKGDSYNIPIKKHPDYEFLYKWKYSGLISCIGSGLIQYSSGECLGGGSEINSGLFHLPPENILIGHQEKEHELLLNSPTNLTNEQKNLQQYFLDGCKNRSLKQETPKRFINHEGQKNSMSQTLLNDYFKKGGKLLLNTTVVNIKKKQDKYELVIFKNNNKKKLNCKNIFICCGAPYSFFLLKKSNIIKGEMENFHFHPMIKIIAKYKENVSSSESPDIINNQVTEYFPNFIFGNAASGKAFLKISTINNATAYQDVIKNFKKMSIFHSTFSFGEGQLIKIPFVNEFLINYKFKDNDLKEVKEALMKLIDFIFNTGAEYIYLCDEKATKIDRQNKNNKINDKIISKLNYSAVHLLGGFKRYNGRYINNYGKINNHNIFVNDSSLISEKLLKNPQGTIMSLAANNMKKIIDNKLI